METKLCGKMSTERWRHRIRLFLFSVFAHGGPRDRCAAPVRHSSLGIYMGMGELVQAWFFFYIDTISMEPEMFTFLVIYNFLPTLNEVN